MAPAPRARETLIGLVSRLSRPDFVRPVAVLAAATAAMSSSIGFLPVVAARAHLGPLAAGAIISLLAAVAALTQPRAGAALDDRQLPATRYASGALIVAAAGFALSAALPGLATLIVAALLIGAGVGVATPIGFAALADSAPAGRMGQTMGAGEVGRELGDAGGPLLVGAMSAVSLAVGLGGLALALGAISVALAVGRRPTRTTIQQ